MRLLSFDIEPCSEPRMVRSDIWNKRTPVLKYRAFCDALRLQANRYKYSLKEPLFVKFYLTMPASWSLKKQKEHDGQLHHQKPDVDNLLKAFMDALSSDDSYMAIVHAEKYWAEKGRIDVMLSE